VKLNPDKIFTILIASYGYLFAIMIFLVIAILAKTFIY
jgi:hypothetical protein